MSEQRLSEAERDELRRRADDDPWEEFGGETILKLLDDHDDLTARLAKVEALADEFHERAQNFVNKTDIARACRAGWLGAARDLRAALSGDPGPEGNA